MTAPTYRTLVYHLPTEYDGLTLCGRKLNADFTKRKGNEVCRYCALHDKRSTAGPLVRARRYRDKIRKAHENRS